MSLNLSNYKSIAQWASGNVFFARILFSFTEIFRLSIAFYLGSVLSKGIGINELILITILIMSFLFTTLKFRGNGGRVQTLFLMSLSWFFSFTFGGITHPSGQQLSQTVFAGDTYGEPQTSITEEVKKSKSIISFKKNSEKMPDSKRRWAYVLLFLLSLPLTYYGLALTCSLGCAGYSFFAILALITSFGLFSGGMFFLAKAFRKGFIKKHKDMERQEKKKEWKRFLLAWAITTGLFGLFLIVINVVNS